jgi:chorismate mutase
VRHRFEEIRAEIVENDKAIISAVNHRLDLVTELWELKAQLGLDTVDPDRERQLRNALSEANTGRLSEAGVERLITDLLDLTKRELGAG